MRAAALTIALVASAATAQDAGSGRWVFDLQLDAAAESAPAFAKLLRESAAARLESFTREMLTAPPPPRCAVDIWDSAVFASPEYISLKRAIVENRGGAHQSAHVEAWTWDVSENRLATLTDFVQGQLALETIAGTLRKAAAGLHEGGPATFWRGEIDRVIAAGTLTAMPFTLAPSTEAGKAAAIDFHFAPHQITPYAAGGQSLRVELSVLDAFLTERARRLFGGDPQG